MKVAIIIKFLLSLVLVVANYISFGQQKEQLQVTILKFEKSSDSSCVYYITIKNASDSIACILHSMFISLTNSKPQGLALYQQSKSKEYYSLHYSFSDTLYNFESLPYRGACILPYQTLSFNVMIAPVTGAKARQLSLEYLYIPDFCYKEFMKDMQQMTTWYLKYKRIEKIMELSQ